MKLTSAGINYEKSTWELKIFVACRSNFTWPKASNNALYFLARRRALWSLMQLDIVKHKGKLSFFRVKDGHVKNCLEFKTMWTSSLIKFKAKRPFSPPKSPILPLFLMPCLSWFEQLAWQVFNACHALIVWANLEVFFFIRSFVIFVHLMVDNFFTEINFFVYAIFLSTSS